MNVETVCHDISFISTKPPVLNSLPVKNKALIKLPDIDPNSAFASSLKKTVKGGYCYIGTDRTFRSCVRVDEGDVCMSNKVFPTKDICINPNLRR